MDTSTLTNQDIVKDTFPINGTDFIEFYVGNAKQTALYYQHCFGFELIAYKGQETGSKDIVSYVVKQGKIKFVFTSAFDPNHEISKHVALHGDGVKVLALWVDDAEEAYYIIKLEVDVFRDKIVKKHGFLSKGHPTG